MLLDLIQRYTYLNEIEDDLLWLSNDFTNNLSNLDKGDLNLVFEVLDILKSTKKGIYAKTFGGGQVDITNGKFVFSASEAYMIENGKITFPIKGATLIGSGFEVLKNVEFVGNDLKMDPGIGTCGKNGQGVPVGVGQPTLKIKGLTVGGTSG